MNNDPHLSPPPSLLLEDAVCARCGCFCDDLVLRYEGDRVTDAERACAMGAEWLSRARALEPAAFDGSGALDVEEAVDCAARMLDEAGAPVLIGLHGLTLEASRAAVRLSMALEIPLFPWPPLPLADARSGIDAPEMSATLAEVRATADLVVFWRADPQRSLPRHLERYSFFPPLALTETAEAPRARRLVVVDDASSMRENATAETASAVVPLPGDVEPPKADLALVLELTEFLCSRRAPEGDGTAEPASAAESLGRQLLGAEHAHIFLGPQAGGHPALRNRLQRLTARVRPELRLTLSCLPADGNPRGLVEVGSWLAGSPPPFAHLPREDPPGPFGAGLHREIHPAWLAGITDARLLASRGLADLTFNVGLETPGRDIECPVGGDTPSISLGTRRDPRASLSFVVPGLDPRLRATVIRGDGISLTLCGGRAAGVPDPAADILARILATATKLREDAP